MSYDLQVFGEELLSYAELEELLRSASLTIEEGDPQLMRVVRGARGSYSFDLTLPVALDPEDVPYHVTALALAPRFLYAITVEGTGEANIPHAVRFGRRPARATQGVFVDLNTGRAWADGHLRELAPTPRGADVDVLDLTWYTVARDPRDMARLWVACARRYLPEALPRRFGFFEPLQGKLDRDGDESFIAESASAFPFTFLSGVTPCVHGAIGGAPGDTTIVAHQLTMLSEPLSDPRWVAAVRRFFTEFASESAAVFASAEIRTGMHWNGRQLSYTPLAEMGAYLTPQHKWMGLPPYPVSWAWFGQDYLDLLKDELAATETESHRNGLLVPVVEAPTRMANLPTVPLAPAAYMATLTRPLRGGESVPLSPAQRRPHWGERT